jgi:hypothetical protein
MRMKAKTARCLLDTSRQVQREQHKRDYVVAPGR